MRTLLINAHEEADVVYQRIIDNYNAEYFNSLFTVEIEDDTIIFNTFKKDDLDCIDFIAHKLASYIIECIEPQIIREEVILDCFHLFEDEIEDIVAKALWEVFYKDEDEANKYFLKLKNNIFDIICDCENFDLEGFLKFRFFDRKLEIIEYIDFAIEQFFEEQENSEIIDFVKNSLSIQESKTNLMHIVIYDKKEFEIIAENFNKLNINDLKNKVIPKNEEYDEIKFIMSILMSYAPKKILIHTNEKQSPYLTRALIKVYGENAEICHGCDFCETTRENYEHNE